MSKGKTKVYHVEVITDKNGKSSMKRYNDGFSAMELLGLLQFISDEVMKQMYGEIEPDMIERQVVKDQ